MPTVRQDEMERAANNVKDITVSFAHPEIDSLIVKADSRGVTFRRKGSVVTVTKYEALQIQRLLGDACSTVWRDDRAAFRAMRGLAVHVEGDVPPEQEQAERST